MVLGQDRHESLLCVTILFCSSKNHIFFSEKSVPSLRERIILMGPRLEKHKENTLSTRNSYL